MNHIILDIETSALPDSDLQSIMPEFEADSRLKDPDKIKADLEKKKESWLSDGALHANRGYVLAAGVEADGCITVLEGDEKSIVGEIWQMYQGSRRIIVGHCIKLFDIPFLIRRSWILGIKVPDGVVNGRYLDFRFVDTMEKWACGTRDSISLDNLSKAFGMQGKNGVGADFARLYKNEATKNQAIEYLKNDIILTIKVAEKMGII